MYCNLNYKKICKSFQWIFDYRRTINDYRTSVNYYRSPVNVYRIICKGVFYGSSVIFCWSVMSTIFVVCVDCLRHVLVFSSLRKWSHYLKKKLTSALWFSWNYLRDYFSWNNLWHGSQTYFWKNPYNMGIELQDFSNTTHCTCFWEVPLGLVCHKFS